MPFRRQPIALLVGSLVSSLDSGYQHEAPLLLFDDQVDHPPVAHADSIAVLCAHDLGAAVRPRRDRQVTDLAHDAFRVLLAETAKVTLRARSEVDLV